MAKEKNVRTNAMRILDRLNISYTSQSYECDEFIDGIHTADILGIDHECCCKTLVLEGKSRAFYVFVLPIEKELDLKACAREAGEKSVEMIPVKKINEVTGYIRGCCTALGMKKQYPVFIDENVKDMPEIYVSAGKLGVQLTLAPEDLRRASGGRFARFVRED